MMKTNVLELNFDKARAHPRRNPKRGALLLISTDTSLHQNLRTLAHCQGRIVVRIDSAVGAAPVVRAVAPAAVLLDLDLPAHAGWSTGERLLREQSCPPLLLLSSPRDQFDLRTAMRAGSLLDKTQDPSRLLDAVDEILALPDSARAERNAVQRVLLRWLNPHGWSLPPKRAYRFWRSNE